jgi:hypothetical protein
MGWKPPRAFSRGPLTKHHQSCSPLGCCLMLSTFSTAQGPVSSPSWTTTGNAATTRPKTNEEAADQIPHQSPSETSRETVQPAAGASGELVPVRLGFDARSCCSQSGRVKMSSLRASATIIVLRVPARRSAVRAWYHRASCREFEQQRSSSHSSLGTAPIAEAAPPAPIFTAPT